MLLKIQVQTQTKHLHLLQKSSEQSTGMVLIRD